MLIPQELQLSRSDPFQNGPLLFTQVSDIHNFLQFFKDGSFSL